jgi:galactonate dehydratase
MKYLSRIETWVTKSTLSDDGWSEIKPFLLLKLTTNNGIEGWGEAFTLPFREKGVSEIIHSLVDAAASIENLTPKTFNIKAKEIADKHRGIDFSAATSAIEMSLWDIFSKEEKKPLSYLLSSKPKAKVSVYANTWSEKCPNNITLGQRAVSLMSDGYQGIKIYPLQNRSLSQAKECVAHIRNLIGFETPLMLDLASPDDDNLGLSLAPLIKEYRPYWYEEPVDGQKIRSLASIRIQTGLKIVTGEKQFEIPHFKEVLAASAADILNPDIAAVGGIIDMTEITNLSAKKSVTISPHCWNSMSVAAAAMIHFCISNSNTEMAEIYPEYISHALKFCDLGFKIKDGYAKPKDRPGLGVVINISSLMAMSSDYKDRKLN